MKTLTERFSSLTYDENNVIVVEGVSESEIANLMSHLNQIVPDFDFQKKNLSKADVMKLPEMQAFIEKH